MDLTATIIPLARATMGHHLEDARVPGAVLIPNKVFDVSELRRLHGILNVETFATPRKPPTSLSPIALDCQEFDADSARTASAGVGESVINTDQLGETMEDPKNPQSGQTQPHLPEDEERNNPQRPGDQADRSRSGKRGQGSESNIPGKERDNEGKIGQDLTATGMS
jgi:hypothetical protein